jgi:nucleoside-diphosphate-sugar epimerase
VIARPEFIYGVGDSHVLGLFKAVQKGLFFYVNGGQAFCHPTFIEDAVTGLIACLERGGVGEVYHICGPRPVTFQELGSSIAHELGVRPPWLSLPYGVARLMAAGLETAGGVVGFKAPLTRTGVDFFSENRRFAIAKAEAVLGFSPQFDLAAGVAKTVVWYKQQGWL